MLPVKAVRTAKRFLRRPALVHAYRTWLGTEQLRMYHRLVRSTASSKVLYSPHETCKRLAHKTPARRALPAEDLHVLAFGREDWESHGLWASFAKVCNFRFVNICKLADEHDLHGSHPRTRQRMAQVCLKYIDAHDRDTAVHLVFFYIDSESLCPELFRGLASRGIWSVVLGLDDKHRFYGRRERGLWVGQETLLSHVDLLWTTWPTAAQLVTDRGAAAWYAPQGADPSFHVQQDLQRDIDVLFLGQKYGVREALVNSLRAQGIAIHAAGLGWHQGHVSFAESIDLINRARIVLGSGATGCMTKVQCLKGRDFEVPMCGAAYLTMFNPELTDLYRVGEEIICYSSATDCAEIIRHLLVRPEQLAAIRRAARARALAQHTWEKRLSDLLALFPRVSESP